MAREGGRGPLRSKLIPLPHEWVLVFVSSAKDAGKAELHILTQLARTSLSLHSHLTDGTPKSISRAMPRISVK